MVKASSSQAPALASALSADGGMLAVALSAISYVSYRDARHEIEELFDAVLAQQARLLAGMISADMAPDARLALQQADTARASRHPHFDLAVAGEGSL